jgi:hypothetical protein
MSLEMLMRNTTTSAFNESLLPSHNLPGDSRILDRMYPAFFVQRDSPLNSNSRLSGMRSENQPQFEMSLRVPKQSHPGVPFRPALYIISFEDMSEGGTKWALVSIESQNLKLSNIQSLPYTQSGTIHARQVLQDSGEDLSISKRLRELIFTSQPLLCAF